MKHYEIKDTDPAECSVKDVDTTSRRVKVAISRMGNKDLDGDVIDKGAYKRTIDQRGPKGANLIWHLTDHMPMMKNAIGKFAQLSTEGDYLVGVTDIPKTSWGNDMMEFYKSGHINQHSIGFRTIKAEPVNAGTPNEYRLIKEVLLYEGSAVLWAANPDTDTISVGKSLTKEEAEKNFATIAKEISTFTNLLSKGNFTDETFELIEMHIAQKTDKLQSLFESTTRPAVKALDSGNDAGLMDVLTTFTHSLIIKNESRRVETTAQRA